MLEFTAVSKRVLVSLALIMAFSAAAEAAVGKIETLVGTVVVQSPIGVLSNAVVGQDIDLGETIITSNGSRAGIRLNDQSLFAISPKTSITIDAFIFDIEEEHTMSARFGGGAFQYTSGLVGKKSTRKVTLPSATVGIRGTTFTVQIDKDSKFILSEGVVEVTTDTSSLVIDKPNSVIDIFENGQFSDIRDLTDEDLAQIEEATGLIVKMSDPEEQNETDASPDEAEEEASEEDAAEEDAAEEDVAEEDATEEDVAQEEASSDEAEEETSEQDAAAEDAAAEEQVAEEEAVAEETDAEETATEETAAEEAAAEEQATEEQVAETEQSSDQKQGADEEPAVDESKVDSSEQAAETGTAEQAKSQEPQDTKTTDGAETDTNPTDPDALTRDEKTENTQTALTDPNANTAAQSEEKPAENAATDKAAKPTISKEEPGNEKRELSIEEEEMIQRAEKEGLITSAQATLLREGPPEDQVGTTEEAETEITEEQARELEQEFARILGIDPEKISDSAGEDDIANQKPEALKVTPEAEKELLELGIKVEEVKDPVSGETRQVFVNERTPDDETTFLSAPESLFLNETGEEETRQFPETEALFVGETAEPQKEEQAFLTDELVAIETDTQDRAFSEQRPTFTAEDSQINTDDSKQLDSFAPKEETLAELTEVPVLESENLGTRDKPVAELTDVPDLKTDSFEIKDDPVAELAEVPVLESENLGTRDKPVAELTDVPALETDSFELKDDPAAELVEAPVVEPDAIVPADGSVNDETYDNKPDLDVLKDEIATIQTDVEAIEDKDNDGLIDKTEETKELQDERLEDISFDRDLDGVPNDVDLFPDDPREFEDSDGDGIGNVADLDDDNDRLSDEEEIALGTSPVVADTDDDGLQDFIEATWLTDPLNPDTDEDGIIDGEDKTPTIFEFRTATGQEIIGDNKNNALFDFSPNTAVKDITANKVVDWSNLIQSIRGGKTQFYAPQQILLSGAYSAAIEPSMLVDFDLNQVHMSARASADFGDFGRFRDVMFQDTLGIGNRRLNQTIEFLDYQELRLENVETGLSSKDVYLRLYSTLHETEPGADGQASSTNVGRLNLRMYNSNLTSSRLGELREIESGDFFLAPVNQP